MSFERARIVTVPNTLNGRTGLICRFIGTPKDLELLAIPDLLDLCKTFPVQGYPEARARAAHNTRDV